MYIENKKQLLIGIVISMIVWGMSWPSAKVLSTYIAPIQLAGIRFLLTTASVFVLLKLIKINLKIDSKAYPWVIAGGFLLFSYNLLFFTGIQKGLAGAGGVLVTTISPLMAYMIALLVARRSPTSREAWGLALGILAGCFLLKIWDNYDKLLDSGNLFFLASTLVWAVLSRITARSSQYGAALAFTFWIYVCTSCFFLLMMDFPLCQQVLSNADTRFWLNLIFNGVFNAGIATVFYFYATNKLGPAQASSFIFIVPFSAAISAYFALGEVIQWNTIVGGLLGISAVFMINRKEKG